MHEEPLALLGFLAFLKIYLMGNAAELASYLIACSALALSDNRGHFFTNDGLQIMKRFLDAHGAHMEFGQLQLNHVDWTFQDAKARMGLLAAHRTFVWVMEPLRGGKLASMSDEDAAALTASHPDEAIPARAFRFLQTLLEVTMTLTGASNMEQLKVNIATHGKHATKASARQGEALRALMARECM